MLLLDALSLNPTPRRPVWIMRQAGRYMQSFRTMREKHSFDSLCQSVELATEISLLPMRQYDFDASIVFYDILYPLKALGVPLHFGDKGPELEAPKTKEDLKKLRTTFSPEESTPTILGALHELRKTLPKEKAVLGFAGAPFTMLAYMLEGKLNPQLPAMKRWMAHEPETVHEWLNYLGLSLGKYLDAQAQSGADAVQLFDTWAGVLSPSDYETFALPYARQALSAVTVPSIYYMNGVAGSLEKVASIGAQGLSIDWRISIGEVRKRVSQVMALQGNLDPYGLLSSPQKIRESVYKICSDYGQGPGHIMNLGHGIVPEIPEKNVQIFIEATRDWSSEFLKG